MAMRNPALGELFARARRLVRRAHNAGGELLRYEDLVLDPAARTARRGSRALELTRTEFELLELLLRNSGRVVTRHEILTQVWGFDFGASSNSAASSASRRSFRPCAASVIRCANSKHALREQ